jgi:chemotaxis protein methyltransferase CheR
MPDKQRNIIEEIAGDFLNTALELRYDICTCSQCKSDMLAHVLSRIPAQYATTETGILYTIIEQTRVEKKVEIARAILSAIEAIGRNPHHTLKEDKAQAFKLLLNKIFEDRRLDFSQYREGFLKRRVALRMHVNKIDSYSNYLLLLIKNPEEYEKLFDVLCINISEFFRDPVVWQSLRGHLESLIQQKLKLNDRHIRIWSAGCANGEEPYSVAILLKEILNYNAAQFSIEIYGTDIDKKCLKAADAAGYPKESLKNVDAKYLKSSFTSSGKDFRVKEEVKNWVQLESRDLILDDSIEATDVILCRNVFIFLGRDLQEQLLTKFYKSLKTGGYLILGKVEMILGEAKEIFEEIDCKNRIFRKK